MQVFGKIRHTTSRPLLWAATLSLSVWLGLIDYLSGWEISFSILYFVPVSIAAWKISKRAGIFLSVFCAFIWYGADLATHPPYSHPAIPVWNASVRMGFLLILGLQLSVIKRSLDREKWLSQRDPLTGAWNSRAFHEKLESELTRSRRYRRPLSLAYLDLDGFKTVNDRLGHRAGDVLLLRVAGVLAEHVRQTDVLARLGGDEFAILFVETGARESEVAMSNVRSALRRAMAGTVPPVTFSVGLVTTIAPSGGAESLIQRADQLMYAAKREGPDHVRHETGESTTSTLPTAAAELQLAERGRSSPTARSHTMSPSG
jgi:diguanylate cyclase (GGDEF)-like protein